jgi:hypothetical protein
VEALISMYPNTAALEILEMTAPAEGWVGTEEME